MLYDISPPLSPATAVWPGDTPYTVERSESIATGGSVNLSSIAATPHLGAHADAPFHVSREGAGIAELPLEPFLGPCKVIEVPPEPLILPAHLGEVDTGNPPRVLLKTGSAWKGGDRTVFPERFSALSPELARHLAENGTLLVGLDTPSVDPFDSEGLPAHHALVEGGVLSLEGLDLDAVPPGVYELIALPLRLEGLDASPVRAVLRK